MGQPNRTYQCYELPPHVAVPCTLGGVAWRGLLPLSLQTPNLKYQAWQFCFAENDASKGGAEQTADSRQQTSMAEVESRKTPGLGLGSMACTHLIFISSPLISSHLEGGSPSKQAREGGRAGDAFITQIRKSTRGYYEITIISAGL
jgi:hypothetical protein